MPKNTFHHEGHRDHEDFCELSSTDDIPANPDSWSSMDMGVHRQGESHFRNNLFFFAASVFFVVQMCNLAYFKES